MQKYLIYTQFTYKLYLKEYTKVSQLIKYIHIVLWTSCMWKVYKNEKDLLDIGVQ